MSDAPAPPTMPPVLVDEREAARLLSCSPATVYRLRRAGALAFVRIGEAGVRYRIADLKLFARSRREREGVGAT